MLGNFLNCYDLIILYVIPLLLLLFQIFVSLANYKLMMLEAK